MILLNLKVFLWNSYRTGAPQKIKTSRKLPEKWTFLSLVFYNAPSLHIVKRNFLGYHLAKYRSLTYQYSIGGQKCHQHSAPVLAILSGNFLAFSRKIIASTGLPRPSASAPVVVKNESPKIRWHSHKIVVDLQFPNM